jgi:EmrB/QacA subfamily drug resistance transporter
MRKWWPLVAICLGTFMLLVDLTIVNVALPSMARSLHSSFASLQWVIDGYALALAAALLVAGSLADRFGRRRLYLAGLGVFAASSLACGLAPDSGVLIAARIVQGTGGAAMFATTAALLSTTYKGRDRGTAFGIWGAVNGFAAACGPLLGGLLIQAWSWRAIVLVNLPVAAVAIAMTFKVIATDTIGRRVRIDLPGAVVFTLASSALVYGLIQAGSHGWASTTAILSLATAAVATAAFIVIEHRTAHPMIDLALFANRSFSALMLAAVVLSGAAFAYLALVSLWLQTVLGLSPTRAGLAVIPLSIASFAVSALAGRHLQRMHPAVPIAAGLALSGTGLLLLMMVGPTSGPLTLLPGLIMDGLGVGLATPVLVSATLAVLPPAQAGLGGAVVNTFRQLGLAVGLAVLSTLFAARITSVLSTAGLASRASALTAGQASAVSTGLARQATASGLDTVFLAAGLAALVAAAVVALFVRRPAAVESAPAAAVTPSPAAISR